VTSGWGVEQDERFTDRMEAALADTPSAPRIEVVNLSVPGYEGPHQFYLFRTAALRLQPDLVVYFFVTNDVQAYADEVEAARRANRRTGDRGVLHRAGQAVRDNRIARAWLPNICDLLSFALQEKSAGGGRAAHIASFDAMPRGIEHVADLYQQSMRLAERAGARLAVLALEPFEPMERACRARGIPYRTIVAAEVHEDPKMRNSRTDAHPNADAHAHLAEQALAALREMNLLPR
jgi:hypothetical protein